MRDIVSHLGFWVAIVVVAMVGIWLVKAAVGAWGPQGAKEFVAGV
jgi:hypothetical protein